MTDIFDDYNDEWNSSIISMPADTGSKFEFLTKHMINLVIKLCAELELSAEIEFTSLDSLDIFYENHFKQLAENIDIKLKSEKTDDITTDELEKRLRSATKVVIENQLLLRVLTVMSLCAKYLYSEKVKLTPVVISELLKGAGISFDLIEINKSEIRVLQSLGFKIRRPILFDAVTFFINKYYLWDNTIDMDEMENVTLQVLRLVYLYRPKIYSKLQEKYKLQDTTMVLLKKDQIILSAAVLYTVSEILHFNKVEVDSLFDILSEKRKFYRDDIKDIAQIILNIIDK